MVRYWSKFPKEAVGVPSLFRARLDGALNLKKKKKKVSPPMGGELELHDLEGLFQPKSVFGPMILQ